MLAVVRRVGDAGLAAGRPGAGGSASSSRRSTPGSRPTTSTLDLAFRARPAVGGDDPGRHRHRLADSHLLDRVHARRESDSEFARYFSYLNLFAAFMLVLVLGVELPGDVRRLGRRRPLLVPADRLLVQEEVGVRRRQEGVRRQPHRRLRVHPRHAGAVRALRHARLPGRSPRRWRALAPETAFGILSHRDAAAVHRRHRQVGADSALHLAAGRDGRPDAGLRADPRGDDGDGRRLHDRPQRGAVQPRAGDDD